MGFFTVRRLATIVALTAAWVGLWGTISFANVAAGIVVATVVVFSGLGTSGQGSVRIVPLLQFLKLVTIDLVQSTVGVAREILTPTDYTEEGIIAVPVPSHSKNHLLLLTIAITLTPGTAVVDADPDTGTLYLHLLHLERRNETVAHVEALAELACAALPVGDDSSHNDGTEVSA